MSGPGRREANEQVLWQRPCSSRGFHYGKGSLVVLGASQKSALRFPDCFPGAHHICWWTSGRCWQRQGYCRKRSVWGPEPLLTCLIPEKDIKGTVWVNTSILGIVLKVMGQEWSPGILLITIAAVLSFYWTRVTPYDTAASCHLWQLSTWSVVRSNWDTH